MSLLDVMKDFEEKVTFRKEATIGGITFGINLLSYEQDQLINAIPEDEDNPLSFYERTRAKILSYAIQKINGENIPDIIEVKDGDKTITKEKALYVRDQIINKLPPTMAERLFEIYADFKDEIDSKLSEGIEYQWYKTPEQRKEERDKRQETENSEAKNESEEQKEEKAPEENQIVFTKIETPEEEVDPI